MSRFKSQVEVMVRYKPLFSIQSMQGCWGGDLVCIFGQFGVLMGSLRIDGVFLGGELGLRMTAMGRGKFDDEAMGEQF